MRVFRVSRTCCVAVLMSMLGASAWGQSESCRSDKVVSVPSRPTIANATDTTQCGAVELEYGVERQWLGGGAQRGDFSGGLRLGLTPNLDFHWFAVNLLTIDDGARNRKGYGDNLFGLKYRILPQSKQRPSVGLMYQAKMPTGNEQQGMSSGQVDHAISLLASKDIHPLHFDFNVTPALIGRPRSPDVDHNVGFALAVWLPLTGRLTLVTEPYGYTELNSQTPAFASVMGGFTFRGSPKCYFDTGIDMGVTAGAPRKRLYGGVTYAIGNVYALLKPRH